MVEECGVLIGEQIDGVWRVSLHRLTSGSAAAVEADWGWALTREETCGDVAGFWHTHPVGGGVRPSRRDDDTMRAWNSALGKPLLCLIADGQTLGGWLYLDDEADSQPVTTVEQVGSGQWRAQ